MADKKRKPEPKAAKPNQTLIYALYALLIICIIGYALTSNILLGLAAFVILVITLVAEFKHSVKEEGVQKSLYDVLVAIVAVVIFWIALVIILGTSSPVNVVASCSMLPTLHRGDLVILHGIPNMTAFLESHDIPIVQVQPQEMNYTLSNMNSEFLAYFAYSPSNKSRIGEIFDSPNYPISLYNTECISTYEQTGEYQNLDRCIASSQDQNLIKYNYSVENVSTGGTTQYIAQTSSLSVANTTIRENYSNPIIVYQTTSNDSFSGDIVHRAVAAIKSGNQYYLLTKGDNNGGLDIQFENYPVQQSRVIGYVIADVPAVGYLRLIISGQLAEPAGCNMTIVH